MVAKPKGLVRGKIVHSREATKYDKVVMKTANTDKIADNYIFSKLIKKSVPQNLSRLKSSGPAHSKSGAALYTLVNESDMLDFVVHDMSVT